MKNALRIFLAISMACAVQACWSQSVGSIVGNVTDPSGAAVSGCEVQATATDTKVVHHADCNASGYYVFPVLPPAQYSITISAPGFGVYTSDSAVLEANQALTVNATLQVATTKQQVTVHAAPTQVNTTTGTISTVIGPQQILNLPLNGRNAAQLTTLVAGAVATPDAHATQGLSIPNVVTISTNGTRGNQISYRLDGANNTDELTNVNAPFPFPDALQEFSVQTGNYSAAFGDSAGGVVNIVTKSGTNQFHGDLFEYVRNNMFNARDYFASSVDNLHRNQFGGTISGPVILPFYNGRNKTFFFFGYQQTRLANTSHGNHAFVPTDAMRNGDYSALLDANSPDNPYHKVIVITDPTTGLPFPGNIILPDRLSPVTTNLYKFIPDGGTTGDITYSLPNNQNTNEYVARFDQTIGTNDHFMARYFYYGYKKQGAFPDDNLFALTTGRSIPSTNAILEETHIFSPNLVNEMRLDYQRVDGRNTTPSGVPNVTSLGVKVNQDPLPSTINGISTNEWGVGGADPTGWVRNELEWSDDVQWVHGRNNFAFGMRLEWDEYKSEGEYGMRPDFGFFGDFTGLDFADMSLGLLNEFDQDSIFNNYYVTLHQSYYAQDDIHLTPRFTLNAGVRYEPFIPWHETTNQLEAFNLANFEAGIRSTVFVNAPPGMIFPGDKGFLDGGVGANFTNISPRLGFAWDVRGNGQTSLRGGIGVFRNVRQPMVGSANLVPPPFNLSITFLDQGTFSDPYIGQVDPFPAKNLGFKDKDFIFQDPLSTPTYNQEPGKLKNPTTYTWNLTLEQQLTSNYLLRISYVGSRATHQFETYNINPARPGPGSIDSRRLYQGYSDIDQYSFDANGWYNALQASFIRRATKNLTFSANYTWSRSLDDLPLNAVFNGSIINPVLPVYVGQGFHRMDYGPSDWDRTNVFSASYVWTLPKLASGNRAARAILNGWETTGIISAQSGQPVTVVAKGDFSGTNLRSDRGVLISPYPYGNQACANQSARCVGWLNPASFTTPAPGTFGNIIKGAFRGPSYVDWDAAVLRNFPIKSRVVLQYRAQFFNVLNKTNFSNPNFNVAGGDFGVITSDVSPRIGQMALMLSF